MEQPQLCFFFLLGVSVAVAQQIRVLPGIETTIELEFLNDGSTQWVNPYLVLSSALNSKLFLVPTQTDIVEGHISSNEVLKVAVLIPPSIQIGLHKISVDLYHNENVFVSTFTRQVEVTCDDGIFCNGIERFVNGNCQNGFLPCDDGVVCTTDHCDNETGTCSWTLNGADCEPCTGALCIPVCDGLECGPDGCDGRCGFCAAGFGCADGKCVVATSDGTCQAPIPLVPDNFSFNERMSVFGDTTGQLNQVVPTCNTLSDAPELVYVFSIPSGRTVGVEARVHDVGERSEDEYDTVLELRKTCSESESVISCSDDGTPPGFLGSRVNALLESGTYYLIVDGYSVDSFGEFEFELNWVDNCMPFCDGSYCDSDLCGGSCGECNPNEICNDLGRCVADPCVPDCEGKSCGTDSCGGNCGICEGNKLCVDDTFTCEEFIPCDHFLPECIGCSETEYCGSDCVCHGINDPRPDLVIDVEALKEVVYDTRMFTPTSCAVFEDCIRGTGMRDIIRLTIGSVNQGFANLIVPEPKTRPDLFSFSECHEHYHFEGFAIIDLLENERDEIVVKGSKVGFCVEDTSLFGTSPAFNCESEYDCGKQGIQAGWVDVYGSSLDCNWIDVTGIPAGDYRIRVSLNADRIIDESTFDNNVAIVPVKVLPKEEESPSTADDLQYDSFSYSRPDSFSSSTSRTTVETNSFSTRTSTKNSESSTSAGCQIIYSALILISMLLL